MSEKFTEQARILSQTEIAPDIFSLWIQTEHMAACAKAGQFLSLYCDDGSRLLPRPISICEIDREKSALRMVYRIAGKGTAEFAAKKAGDQLRVTGPLGNGFPLKEKKAFLIGGGIGVPPML
ncbi:MAG: FAD-binding oxidoreductase, partial [Clostridiales bacterium]|nr:FAD-binding oxidoreductase [Clostridiales bacterium]